MICEPCHNGEAYPARPQVERPRYQCMLSLDKREPSASAQPSTAGPTDLPCSTSHSTKREERAPRGRSAG